MCNYSSYESDLKKSSPWMTYAVIGEVVLNHSSDSDSTAKGNIQTSASCSKYFRRNFLFVLSQLFRFVFSVLNFHICCQWLSQKKDTSKFGSATPSAYHTRGSSPIPRSPILLRCLEARLHRRWRKDDAHTQGSAGSRDLLLILPPTQLQSRT